MFKLKNLYIVSCLLGLAMYAAPAWASICFAPSGGCVDPAGGDISDNTNTQGSLNECIGFTLYEPEEGDGWNCSSCVQTNGTTLYKCKKNTCGSEYDIKKDGEEPPKALPGWECEACLQGYEQFWYCPKHSCAPKYGERKASASAAKFSCEGSEPDTCQYGDDTLYNCECDSEHKEREIDGVASCVRICKAEEHREYNPQTDKCECEQYYTEKNGACVHDDYSADCQATLDNLYAVSYTPLSKSECDSLKIRLGINKCIGGTDYWAGAAKACEGADNMPTPDELTKLAQCMYNQSSFALAIYGKRNDSYLEELGISTDDHVFVWTDNQSKKNEKSMVRMFAKDSSLQYWAERDGSKYYTGNGDTSATWDNNSILSQTLCRRNNEPAVSCDGCDYCIASTCKSSGENRIISDSSTYEKCSDSCGGKYRCKTGYTAKYAGSNQYKCVKTSGCYYDTVAQCKTAGYTYTAEERWWMQDENMTHECEPCDCGGTEMNKCVPVGVDCSAQYKSQCDSWGGTLKNKTTSVNEDVCHAVFGQCDGKYWYCLKPGCSDDGNNKVTVYYDAPTNCNYAMNLTNTSTGAVTQVGSATQTINPGTYTVRPSTSAIQSFTIKMGRGGTPTNFSISGGNYTFSIGNEYWITPSCSSGGGSSGGGSSGGSTTSCSGARPVKFTNIPMSSSSTTCIDVCCGPNADVPSSYSYLGDCNGVGSTYTCPPTTSSILCYRDIQGILHETDGVETGSGITRHCVPGWIQVPHYTRCFGSYLVGCTGGQFWNNLNDK